MRTERGPTARSGQVGRRAPARSRRRVPRGLACERLEQRALLAFSPPAVFPVGDNPATVALADFDNDGRVDIVTADGGAISFGVLVNTTPTGGQVATFRPQVAFTTTGAPVALAVGDFNADGKPDVAVATAGSIEVFINQTTDSVASGGTLSFSGPTVLTLGGALTAVAIGDVNGDSKPDIVATSADDKVTVFASTTGPSATVATFSTAVSTTLIAPQALVIRDLNADGMPDVAVACGATTAPGSVAILVNTTAGVGDSPSFIAATSFPVGLGPRGIAAGDFNADGRPDLAVANTSSDSVSIVLNATVSAGGTPAFAAQTLVAVGSSPRGIAVGDVNRDGKPDIAVANAGADTVRLFSNGTAALATVVDFSVMADEPAAGTPVAVAIGEFTGDGVADLAFAAADTASVGVLLQDVVAPTLAIETATTTLAFGQSTTVTFTFSEPVSGFTNADVQVTGGTLTGFTQTGSLYTATFTAGTTVGQAKIVVAAGAYADLAGQASTVDSSAVIDVVSGADTTPPTVAITSTASVGSGTVLGVGDTATITFTLSEPSNDFAAEDVHTYLGTLSGFQAVSPALYTATFTPTPGISGEAAVYVDAGSFSDLAGNANLYGAGLQIYVSTIVPTVSIDSTATALKAGETATITFTLSEPSPDFGAGSVAAVGGTLSGFAQQSATVYTATFTPLVNFIGEASIAVVAGTFTNAAGNANQVGAGRQITVDTEAPLAKIASTAATLRAGQTATIFFRLSVDSTGFTDADIQVGGGTLSPLMPAPVLGEGPTTPRRLAAIFTPFADSTAPGTITVPAGTFGDAAGNLNLASELAPPIQIDTQPPAVTITASAAALKAGEQATITFTLSEPSGDFDATDVLTTLGTLSGFTAVSGTVYTATFTPDAGVAGTASITVPPGSFTDTAGNANVDGPSLQIAVNTIAPTIAIATSATALSAGQTATITFTLSEPADDFAATDVLVGLGTLSGFAQQSATVYTATFTPDVGVVGPTAITVVSGRFTNAAGNANVANQSQPIAVNTIAPTVAIGTSATTLKAGQTATISFTLSEPASDFDAGDVQVTGGTLSGFAGAGASYTATFTPLPDSTLPGTVSVPAGAFHGPEYYVYPYYTSSPNLAAALAPPIQIDTRLPTVTIASGASMLAAGEQTTITFTLSAPSPNFTAAAVDVLYGSLSGFAPVAGVTGLVYTATFTADPTLTFYVIGGVEVPAGRFTDEAGNANAAASGPITITVTYGVPTPTVAIGTSVTTLKAGQTATLSFTLSEPVYDFDAGDVQVTGGTLSGFAGTGASYTATFTPLPDSTLPGTVSVPAGAFHGALYYVYPYYTSSPNLAAALEPPIQIDTRAPTIAIASSTPTLLVGQTATITFTLSEKTAVFTLAAIQATGGTLAGLSQSGTSYTAVFTPQPGFLGTGEVRVAAGAFTDGVGNPNPQPAAVSLVIDTQPPAAIAAGAIPAGFFKAGTALGFTVGLNEPVTVTGTPRIPLLVGNAWRYALYAGSPDAATLRFVYTVQPGDNTPVGDRTGPRVAGAIDLAGGAIRDPMGNDVVPALPTVGAADVVVDTTPPTVAVTSSRSLLGAGQTAVVTFTLSEPSPDFGPGSVAAVGGTLSGFAGSGTVYTALFTPQTNLTGTATVKVDVGRFTDRAGNAVAVAVDRTTAVDTALRFAAGTDGQSVFWDREFAYRAVNANTIRLPLPASQAAFFVPKTVLSITPNNAAQSLSATVKGSRYDAATGAVVVTLDKKVPVTSSAGYGTLVLGGIVPPGARLLAGVSGAVVHEYGAADLLKAGYSTVFVTRFQGGLRTAAADLDENGFADIIVAPGGVPNLPDPLAPGRRLADVFGNSLRTVAIFDGSPTPAWAPVKLDVGPVLGVASQGGFQVAAGNIVSDATGSGTLELVVASGTRLAVYDVRIAAPGARPSINPVPIRVLNLGAGQTATGVATGRLFADDPYDDVVVAATTAVGRVAGSTTVSILGGPALGVVRSFAVTSSVESGPSRKLTDVFGYGASLAVGDVDGDTKNDLVLGAGAGGLGNFRVLANESITATTAVSNPAAFAAAITTQLGPEGRFAQYRAPTATWRPTGGPDYFTPGIVTGPTGQGFNAPVSVRVVNVSTTGSARAEVFAALGAANQTANTVKRFLFEGPGNWTSAAAFDLLPSSAGDLRFRRGAGVRLG